MPIITVKEVTEGLHLSKLGPLGTVLGEVVLHITKLNALNKIYDDRCDLPAEQFLDSALKHVKVNYKIPDKDLKRIPAQGAFITISNHPLGLIDGMILMNTLIKNRPDYKVLGNFLLERFRPLAAHILPVNPFEGQKAARSSLKGLRAALYHLEQDHPLGIFPAGEVSTTKTGGVIVDRPWLAESIKLIQKAQVPVVPVYFQGRNSRLFYQLARYSDALRTAKLPSEMVSNYNRSVKVRIGNPIPVEVQQEYNGVKPLGDFLRKKTYMLASGFDKKSFMENMNIPTQIKLHRSPKKIAKEISQNKIIKEIEFCRTHDKRLLNNHQYEVFLATQKEIPNIVNEIGRLREITFRQIGEGTNRAVDLDEFDLYYHHLFLYDKNANRIVGAYRMGMGKLIFKKYGIDGFYLQKLFRFEPELYQMMSESIEMGRAFIIKGYQKKAVSLYYLWKGIIHCTLRFPQHKYLIGGVSISDKFSQFSKSLMIEFMKSHYYDPYIAQYVRPKKEFKVKLKDADKNFVFDESKADLNKFDRLINELEPGSIRMPVLLKKYIKQNAKVAAFNVDPLFNNSIDGLMYIQISDIPDSTIHPIMEEFQKELEKKMATKTHQQ